jgi:glyoxalase family protein
MELDGIHHVTCVTGDPVANERFYTGVLGLRLIAREGGELVYGDADGSPGSLLAFVVRSGAGRGRAGAGMGHRIAWRAPSVDSLAYWAARVEADGGRAERLEEETLRFQDFEGLELELRVSHAEERPLVAIHPDVPPAMALHGFAGVYAYSDDPSRSREFLQETMGAATIAEAKWGIRGSERGNFFAYDPAPDGAGSPGAGTVHRIAWSSPEADHEAWRRRIADAGFEPTEIVDGPRYRAFEFREPSGVLFAVAACAP